MNNSLPYNPQLNTCYILIFLKEKNKDQKFVPTTSTSSKKRCSRIERGVHEINMAGLFSGPLVYQVFATLLSMLCDNLPHVKINLTLSVVVHVVAV